VFATLSPLDVSCSTDLRPVWKSLQDVLLSHFTGIARFGWQFERFEDAWCAWLEANSRIDWMQERLDERVQSILVSDASAASRASICGCAAKILVAYGKSFRAWMDDNLVAGHAFGEFTPFAPGEIATCADVPVTAATAQRIADMLAARYASYTEVSYRLWVVVSLLGTMSNTYPSATLHDCDDGSDVNPVRLGSTALGGRTLRASATPRLTPQP
jgi:hypothetical protein